MKMPRAAREKSQSETYHIMLRGINQQQIFEDEEDYQKFIEIIKNYQAICEYKIFAYCLMGNHVHLLMEFKKEPIEQAFKRIGSKYVYWYNVKYQRKGHLFQDRFKSEPVDDDPYFLTVIRYIHQNPVKAGLCKKVEEYKYSSYGEYLNGSKFIDTEYVFSVLPKKAFIEYNNEEDIFIHYSAIEMDGYKTLTEGALVQYELHRTDKGLQARKVLQVCCD